MNIVSKGAGRGGPKVREELVLSVEGDNREGEFLKNRSGWGRRRDNGDGGFDNCRWEVLNWDIHEQDTIDDFLKLKVDISILGFIGRGVLKLQCNTAAGVYLRF